jgi:hypothetical protein
LVRDSTLKCAGKKRSRSVVFDVKGVECWFLEEGSDSGHLEVSGDSDVTRDQLMREAKNGRSTETVWRREEGMALGEKGPYQGISLHCTFSIF